MRFQAIRLIYRGAEMSDRLQVERHTQPRVEYRSAKMTGLFFVTNARALISGCPISLTCVLLFVPRRDQSRAEYKAGITSKGIQFATEETHGGKSAREFPDEFYERLAEEAFKDSLPVSERNHGYISIRDT